MGRFVRGNRFLVILILYIMYAGALISTYTTQLAEANAYTGMQPWNMSLSGWLWLLGGLPVIGWITYRIKGVPSDFFLLFYGAIAVVSFLTLHSVSGKVEDGMLLPAIVIMFLPLLAIEIFKKIIPAIKIKGALSSGQVSGLIFCIVLFVVAVAFMNHPSSAGFSLDDSHERRLQGRDMYAGGSPFAYALGMCMNGFLPYLSFKGGLYGKKATLILAFLGAVFFFWLVGVKSPLLYVPVAFALGVMIKKKSVENIGLYFLLVASGLWGGVVLEWMFFDNYSLIADYFFRRLFPVQAEVQGYYLDFLWNEKLIDWTWWWGAADPGFQATYYIGEQYFDRDTANVNTNTFLEQLMAHGLRGYISSLLVVPAILVFFDRLWQATKNPSYLFLGFMYGLLVVEQTYTVAMISSGVGFLFVATAMERVKTSRNVVATKSTPC